VPFCDVDLPIEECGTGKPRDAYHLPLAAAPNESGCFHCPQHSCDCQFFSHLLDATYASMAAKRKTETAGSRHLCAKSLLPQFVSRIVRLMKITSNDTFYDLGCGNGSVMFQVAYMTGARCVGVELSAQNAELARQAWTLIKPVLEKKANRKMPDIEIITGDLCDLISTPTFASRPSAILTSNLLFPKSLTHYMSERFRSLPVGTRIMCFDDLYPHGRSVARLRDPEAFELFDMVDYIWQEMSVEWCAQDGPFFYYYKKQ